MRPENQDEVDSAASFILSLYRQGWDVERIARWCGIEPHDVQALVANASEAL